MLAMDIPASDVIEAANLLEQERTLYSVSLRADSIPDLRLTDIHRRVLSYWLTKRDAFDAPRRADIDPCDLGATLPNVMLWDIDGYPDYRCRLAGTEVCHNMFSKMQGIMLGDLPCPLIADARREFDAARDHGLVSLSERTLHWLGRPLVYYRHLLMPLVNNEGRRHMLLGVMTFHGLH